MPLKTQIAKKSPFLLLLLLVGCASNEKGPVTTQSKAQDVLTLGNRQAVVDVLQLQGQPYVYGGESPQEGFDCSGLVYYVYNRQGLRLPRDTFSLAMYLPPVQLEERQPGDLLFFRTEKPYSHVGIYVGDDRFVHAASSRSGRVMTSDLRQPYWRDRFIAVRRPLAPAYSSILDWQYDLTHCSLTG